ncbi:MAG: radical SAM protein [Candidatus Riflebacteria bacterium]|nr:radical SAM protein [Candidatus Riflebacteria bacterium]
MASEKTVFDPTPPVSIELHLTNRCNLNCKWCVDRGIRNNPCDLPFDISVRFLNECVKTRIGITIEGGGEPTIYPFFEAFILEAAKREVPLGLITNGVRSLRPDLIKHFQWIRVSVDAGTAQEYLDGKGTDHFESVLHNIEEICKHKLETLVGVGYVLTKENYKNVPTLLWRLLEMQVDFVQIRVLEENDQLKVSPKILSQVKNCIQRNFSTSQMRVIINQRLNTNLTNNDNLPCFAHSIRAIIHADGFLHLCEKRRHDPIILGSLVQNSFFELWNSKARREASLKLLDPRNQIGCTICRITDFNHLFYNLNKIKTKNFI